MVTAINDVDADDVHDPSHCLSIRTGTDTKRSNMAPDPSPHSRRLFGQGNRPTTLAGWLLAGLVWSTSAASAAPDSLIGRSVITPSGEELGRVHDFSVDLASGEIRYVVVSVGSFLIDDAFIAVAPAALQNDRDTGGLVLQADREVLRQVPRFAAGRWPDQAQVTPAATTDSAGDAPPVAVPRGSATISDGSRTATLADGERNIEITGEAAAASAPAADSPVAGSSAARATPRNRFERLDRDGDGVLDRAEIAHELGRSDSYADIDLDASGGIDEGEFDRMLLNRSGEG